MSDFFHAKPPTEKPPSWVAQFLRGLAEAGGNTLVSEAVKYPFSKLRTANELDSAKQRIAAEAAEQKNLQGLRFGNQKDLLGERNKYATEQMDKAADQKFVEISAKNADEVDPTQTPLIRGQGFGYKYDKKMDTSNAPLLGTELVPQSVMDMMKTDLSNKYNRTLPATREEFGKNMSGLMEKAGPEYTEAHRPAAFQMKELARIKGGLASSAQEDRQQHDFAMQGTKHQNMLEEIAARGAAYKERIAIINSSKDADDIRQAKLKAALVQFTEEVRGIQAKYGGAKPNFGNTMAGVLGNSPLDESDPRGTGAPPPTRQPTSRAPTAAAADPGQGIPQGTTPEQFLNNPDWTGRIQGFAGIPPDKQRIAAANFLSRYVNRGQGGVF